jgi:hypothetical protein
MSFVLLLELMDVLLLFGFIPVDRNAVGQEHMCERRVAKHFLQSHDL